MSTRSLNQDMVLVGLEGAGKTSIISRVFKFFSADDLVQLTPTVLVDASFFSLNIIQRPISVLDLGGQEQFLWHHLNNPEIFTNANIIIYVVDVQRLDRLKKVLTYFNNIKAILQKSPNAPREFLLLHKFDKSKRDELNFVLPTVLVQLLDVLGNDTTFFMTSIYDDSLIKVFTYILSFLFPLEVISQGLSHELSITLLPEIVYQIANLQNFSISTVNASRVYDFMNMFGKIVTNNIVQRNWHSYFAKQLNLPFKHDILEKKDADREQLSTTSRHGRKNGDVTVGENNKHIFTTYLDDKTIFFELNFNIPLIQESTPKKSDSTYSEEEQEFFLRFILLIATQGLIKGLCESVGCSLELLTLIPHVDVINGSFQLEGVVKCR